MINDCWIHWLCCFFTLLAKRKSFEKFNNQRGKIQWKTTDSRLQKNWKTEQQRNRTKSHQKCIKARWQYLQSDIVKRSALDPIGRSPFLPSWNLHKVELFSAFISHLDDISSWKCSWKCESLQFERKKNSYERQHVRTQHPDGPVYYANH